MADEVFDDNANVAYVELKGTDEDNYMYVTPDLRCKPDQPVKEPTKVKTHTRRKCTGSDITATFAMVTAIFALIVAVIAVSYAVVQLQISNQQIEKLQSQTRSSSQEVQGLQAQLNNSNKQIEMLQSQARSINDINTASSCNDIPQDRPSGYYHIQTGSNSPPVWVYCDTNRTSCSCNTTGGWMRVANLNMTDPNQNCPDGFRLVNRTEPPLRTCGIPESISRGCVSTIYQTYGVEYSQVCGRIIGYQFGFTNGLGPNINDQELSNIDRAYVDGVTLTHGELPRQHIWTFAAASTEVSSRRNDACPCIDSETFVGIVPAFINQNYFCETGNRDANYEGRFFADDPLWDGQGCGGTSTCCQFNNPPWFCQRLSQPTTDDIELRLCRNLGLMEEPPIELVEIYVY